MRAWHHTIHYKTKVKTGEYSFGDNEPKLGEVELITWPGTISIGILKGY